MGATGEPRDYAAAHLKDHTITVLLIDDQAMVGEAVRRMLVSESDIVLHYCQDPTKAIKTALEIKPTVILQDLVMPVIDGMTLVRFFRANEKTRDIPLIVLSSKEEPVVKAEAFGLGANDYLVKLPDKIELIARIRYHSKGYINLLQRNEALRQLTAELNEAAEYVKKILPEPLRQGPVLTDWRFIPSTSLGGDSFGYHALDEDHFVIYLLDVCGHGVGAALLSVSVMNVLRSQTLPNTDFREPDQVLTALNDTFQMENHNNMYFTIWYGVYNMKTRSLAYANGGHPPALLLEGTPGEDGAVVRLANKNTIIGGLPGLSYRRDTCQVPAPARLYVFSDGVYEVAAPGGTMWELDEFVEFMSVPPPDGTGSNLDRLWSHVRLLRGSDNLEDDFSILEVDFE
jgi:sigma-B regulation protein RsbU (phosphoserine phosphatase)